MISKKNRFQQHLMSKRNVNFVWSNISKYWWNERMTMTFYLCLHNFSELWNFICKVNSHGKLFSMLFFLSSSTIFIPLVSRKRKKDYNYSATRFVNIKLELLSFVGFAIRSSRKKTNEKKRTKRRTANKLNPLMTDCSGWQHIEEVRSNIHKVRCMSMIRDLN